MATVVFDFDSTLVRCESLEEILAAGGAGRPDLEAQIRRITDDGMAGRVSFAESLRRRLEIARPHRDDVVAFAARARGAVTPGLAELIADLRRRDVHVAIVSGAFRDAMLPATRDLGIDDASVHGVGGLWTDTGEFAGFAADDVFARSKTEGVATIAPTWTRPRIGVGDGMTDRELHVAGLVDHFIAFTANVRREAVVATGDPEARSVAELRRLIDERLIDERVLDQPLRDGATS